MFASLAATPLFFLTYLMYLLVELCFAIFVLLEPSVVLLPILFRCRSYDICHCALYPSHSGIDPGLRVSIHRFRFLIM